MYIVDLNATWKAKLINQLPFQRLSTKCYNYT